MGGESHRSMAAPSKEYPKLAAGPVGKQIRSLYQARLGQFTDRGQYYGMSP
jgi:alpha-mannosidase